MEILRRKLRNQQTIGFKTSRSESLSLLDFGGLASDRAEEGDTTTMALCIRP